MKKLFSLLLLAIITFSVLSCRDDDYRQDNDTYPVAIDITENFVNSTGSNADYLYGINKQFNKPLGANDVVLIYRQDNSSGVNVWKLLPKTYYLTEGELDYSFDFTRNDIMIYANGSFNLTNTSSGFKATYLNNQTFRVVMVPASGKNAQVNYEDYNSVAQYFHIDESKIQKL